MGKMVLFDFDGVLCNTEEVGYHVVDAMLKEHGINYSRTEYVEMLSGITHEEFHQKLRSDNPNLPADFREKLDEKVHEAFDQKMAAIDGAKELLQKLKREGIPFAVCSNSEASSLVTKLRKIGLFDDFVPYIYSREHVDNAKPAPDIYLLAAKNRGIDPKDCLVVEDSITGTKAGVAAGMTVVGFIGESHRDDAEADLLTGAGAKMISLSHDQTWDHIENFADLSINYPFMGPDLQL